MEPEVESFGLAPDGEIPNNSLPLLLYRRALPPELQSPSGCQALFARNLLARQLGERHLRLLAFPYDGP